MKIGERVRMEKSGRRGTIVYIHPRKRFYVLQMDAGYCESFKIWRRRKR